MDRQHRRDLRHDKFVDEIGSLSTRARENQRLLYTITLGLVVVALIGYGIYFYRSNREQKAQDLLATAIDTIESPLITPGQPAAPNAKFKTEAERTAKAESQFNDLEKQYSGTDAADVGNLYLARIQASRGDVAGAKKLLEAFISDHPDHLLVGAARYSLYQLRIESGEAAQVATEVDRELAKQKDQILPGDTLLVVLAHAYDAQGNDAKSKDAYRRIVTEFPDSPYAVEANRRVGPA